MKSPIARRFSLQSETAALVGFTLFALAAMSQSWAQSTSAPMAEAQVTTVFECSVMTNGTRKFPEPNDAGAMTKMPCFYRLIATRCQVTPNKPDSQTCHTDSLMEFQLAAGVKKEVTKLPANFQYCVGITATPSVSDCVANPVKR
jgi:hypothetical protein